MEKEEIEKLVAETVAKAVKERLGPINSEIQNIKLGLKAEVKGFDTLKERVDGFEGYIQDMIQRKGADEYKGLEEAIKQGFKDLIDYKKAFEAKMDKRRLEAQKAEPAKLGRGSPPPIPKEPMETAIPIDRINWQIPKKDGGGAAREDTQFAWAWVKDTKGNLRPESTELVQALRQYGEVKIGKYICSISKDGKFLNRRIPRAS